MSDTKVCLLCRVSTQAQDYEYQVSLLLLLHLDGQVACVLQFGYRLQLEREVAAQPLHVVADACGEVLFGGLPDDK